MNLNLFARAAVFGGAMAIAAAASAVIPTGIYALHNHPDGSEAMPLYGARLDELYNVTGNHDVFTFDFDHANSAMFLTYDGSSVHIFGQAFGGRDIGSTYANDIHLGMYTFDFLYNWGVGLAPGDDDVLVEPGTHYNYGSVVTAAGDAIALRDGHYGNGQPDFRFGNEDNDLGHRGFNGISGWGWIFHGAPNAPYIASSDWLFTATLVPAPGTSMLVLGSLVALRRRRR